MTLPELPVRALQRLDAASSRLRHSVVQACFYNLRVLAQELPGRRGNGDFHRNLTEALENVATARRLIDEHFAYPLTSALRIADVFHEQHDAIGAALVELETQAEGGVPGREDQPACESFAEATVSGVDQVLDAIGEMERAVAAARLPSRELLAELMKLHGSICAAEGVQLGMQDDCDAEPRVFVDREHLLGALSELVRNALRHAFADAGGGEKRIIVGLAEEAETRDVLISVCDNGQGMTPERLALLGSAGASTTGGGDGIAMVRRVVEGEHGGVVSFESTPGQGTCARVRLPRRAEPALEEAGPPAEVMQVGPVPEEEAGRHWSLRRVGAAAAAFCAIVAIGAVLAWFTLGYERSGRLTVAADGSGQYASIAEAVAAAKSGAVIDVAPGVYDGPVAIERAVEIDGPPGGGAVLQADSGPVVLCTAKGAAIRDLRVALKGQDQSAAVLVDGGDLTMERCEVTSQGLSCVEVAAGAPTVRGCLIHEGRSSGIFVHDAGAGLYEGNRIADCAGSGVSVSGGANPVVRGNTIERCRQGGVNVYDGGRGTFERDDVSHCVRAAVLVQAAGAPAVRFCELHDNPDDGLVILQGAAGTYEHNRIYGNAGRGAVVPAGSAARLASNTVEGNGAGDAVTVDGGGSR